MVLFLVITSIYFLKVYVDYRNLIVEKPLGFVVETVRKKENYTQLESSQHLIFVCKTGMRSKKAIDWLLTKFPDKLFYNIHNGTEMLK